MHVIVILSTAFLAYELHDGRKDGYAMYNQLLVVAKQAALADLPAQK